MEYNTELRFGVTTGYGARIAERTLREQLQKRGLTRAELLRDQRTFGRYEAAEPNERWIADVLIGSWVPQPRASGSQKARLFLIVDDHSRLLVHGRWFGNETLRAGQEVLHAAILRPASPLNSMSTTALFMPATSSPGAALCWASASSTPGLTRPRAGASWSG